MNYIEISSLSKKINDNIILNNINLSIKKGLIYGFLGNNGSGKTMLFRLISGLVKPTDGRILINNKELGKDIDFVNSCGVIIDKPNFWSNYTGFENLKMLSLINNSITDEDITNILIRVGLSPNDKKKYKKYSLGMKQKLGIAQAIMEKPELLILDEPTNGLDHESVEKIRNILIQEKERGATILISSHNKDDINILTDHILKLEMGTLSQIK